MRRQPLVVLVLCLALLWAACPAQADPSDLKDAPNEELGVTAPAWDHIPLQARVKIDPSVLKALLGQPAEAKDAYAASNKATFLVYLREQAATHDLDSMADRAERRQTLVGRLQATARTSQAKLVAYLDQQVAAKRVARYQSYWIFNGIAVEGDLDAVIQIASRPEVEAVRANRIHRLPAPQGAPADAAAPEWNIAQIEADRVWEAYSVTGAGIVVANLDSGVDWTHPALQRKYRGYNASDPAASVHDYNWYDPTGTYRNAPGPNQPNLGSGSDHGTHTMGTIVGSEADGSNPIGVAPGAQWVAVKVFGNDGYATDEWLHAGFQWCLAPTDLNGNNPDPSRAPDIVSNSWGDDNGYDETFSRDVSAWNAAGIFSTWAAGNAGPDAGTVGSPASLAHSFAVGATDRDQSIASFSSRGPSPWGEIKPEVAAPGVNVRSSIAGGTYESGWSGTSMATPHVAGLAALMWQAAGHSLSITATAFGITSTAAELGPVGEDNAFGYGLIDAYQAVGSVLSGGTFAGRVTDATTGAPISGASVRMVNLATGGQAATQTLVDGSYSFAVAEGRYDVTASRFGYHDSVATSVDILPQTVTQLDLALIRQPSGAIRGRVTRTSDGLPVAATVVLVNAPLQTTVDAAGYYTLTAPVGAYTIRALPQTAGYRGAESANIQVAQDAVVTQNLMLATAPRILLVDAEASSSPNTLSYYRSALDGAMLGYDTHRILDASTDVPSAGLLGGYDIVIWSQPARSPGYIGAWDELGAFLDQGGRLLISGQDIGYWDYYLDGYRRYLHATYQTDDGGLEPLTGVPDDILDGLTLSYNTADSARNQDSPDAIAAGGDYAIPIVAAASGILAGVRGDSCAFRSIYLSFGLEGIGPAAVRQEALVRAIAWLDGERPDRGVTINMPLIAKAGGVGATVTYDLAVINDGSVDDRYTLTVISPSWPARLLNVSTGQVITRTGVLTPCSSTPMRLEVTIPGSAAVNQMEATAIRVVSLSDPSVIAERTLTTTALRPWIVDASLPKARYRLACAAADCAVYAIGGYDLNDSATNTVQILDLTTGTWTAGASKPTVGANSAVALLNGLIYVLGGYDPDADDSFHDTVEVFDPERNSWSAATALPEALSSPAAAAHDGKIYLFGGSAESGLSNRCQVYDPVAATWSEIAPLPTDGLAGAGAVSLGEYVYVGGGWPNRSAFYRYDPAANTWVALSSMIEGRNGFAMAAVAGHIYVAGGGNQWSGIGSAERYDPAQDQWINLLPLTDGDRSGSGGATVDGRFYVLGGTTDQDYSATTVVEYLDIASSLSGSGFEVSAPVAQPGDTLDYALHLINPSAMALAVHWAHIVPGALDYVSGSNTGGSSYDAATRTLYWSGDVPAGAALTFGLRATVRADVAQGALITSTVMLDGVGCSAGQMSAVTRVSMPSLERSTKVVDKSQSPPGGRLHYTVNIANGTPYTITDATLVDPIPANTIYVSGSATGGAVFNAGLQRIEWVGDVPPMGPGGSDFDWRDATSGQVLDLSDDSCTGPLDLGFELEFYGRAYSRIYVNSNGMVLFNECSTSLGNTAIPSADAPNGFVAPLWDDLIPGGQGRVHYKTFGTAPNRSAVIEWHQVPFYNTDQRQTFEVVLHEGSNSVVFQYLDVNGDRGAGSSATVGIEDADGSVGVQYLLDGSPPDRRLYDGLAVELEHSSTRKASVHQISYDVVVNNPAPPLTVITNTATIYDGRVTHQRVVTSVVDSPHFGTSTKVAQPQSALSGQVLTYTLQLVNTGAAAAVDAHLVDALPAGVTFVPGSLVGAGATYDAAARTIHWRGPVASGPAGVQISYRATIDAGLPHNTWLTNTATLTEQGVTLAVLQAGVIVNEINLAASSKAASAAEIGAGGMLTYTITVRNTGLATATQARLTDPLPSALDLVEGSLEGGAYDSALRTVTWQGSLSPMSEHTVRFRASTGPNTVNGTSLLNRVLAEDGSGRTYELTATTTVLRGDLAASQLLVEPAGVAPGGAITCTLRVRNTGAFDIGGELSLPIPTPFVVNPATIYASSGAVSYEDGTLRWSGSVLSGAMVLVRIGMTAPAATPEQAVALEAHLVDAGGIETVLRRLVRIGELPYAAYLPRIAR